MEKKVVEDPLDARLAVLAARQHGVVSRRQLAALGLGDGGINQRVRAGRLHRAHRGVYAVGHPRLSLHGLFLAAVLACGHGALLSHASAARLWALPWRQPAQVHVTVPTPGGRKARAGITVHRMAIKAGDATITNGVPVTSPARTLIDLADSRQRRPLERAIDEAAFLRLDLTGLTPRHGRRGSGFLAEIRDRHRPGTTLTRSQLEEMFLELCHDHRLPPPLVNTRIEGYEVDSPGRSIGS